MNRILYIAIDVDDKAFHGHAIASDQETGLDFQSRPSAEHFIKAVQKIAALGDQIKICYEATYLGYSLYRTLTKNGLACEIIAPSLVPKPSGVLVKTDRIDARLLAHYYKKGLLTAIHIPTEEQEAVRDLLRSRHFLRRQTLRVKHHLLSLCRRLGVDYKQQADIPTRVHWTKSHVNWLKTTVQKMDNIVVKLNLEALLGRLDLLEAQIGDYDDKIRLIAQQPAYHPPVQALCCYRGIDVLSAITLVTEIGDIRRFDHPRRLTSYAGMDLIEYSSGGKERKFSMSKLGNRHIRTTVIEACQYAFNMPVISKILRDRRQGTPVLLVDIADRCMQRLSNKSRRLLYRCKPRNKIKAACAREMLCFIWESLSAVHSST